MNNISRRSFLKGVAGSATGLALAQCLSPSLLMAQTMSAGSGKNFIVVNLFGGVDGLSMCPYYRGPVADLLRTQLRPTINVASASVLPLVAQTGEANGIGLHPALAKLKQSAGANMKIIQKYGIPADPGRSHDTCQILFSLGRTRLTGGDQQGVLAKLMDLKNWESFQYWAIGSPPDLDVNTFNKPAIVLSELASFDFNQAGWEGPQGSIFAAETHRLLLEIQTPRNQAAERYKTALQAMHQVVPVIRSEINSQTVGGNTAGNYSADGVGPTFRDAAKVLKAKGVSSLFGQQNKDTIIYLNQLGYDTHSNQFPTSGGLPGLLTDLSNNLAVLIEDLKRFGMWNNSVILLFSEFGRTVFQNGTIGQSSVGTDHGWGNNTLVMGGNVRAGVLGEAPSSSELLNRNVNALVPSLDFRHVWGDVLTWLNVSPSAILDEPGFSYSPVGIFN